MPFLPVYVDWLEFIKEVCVGTAAKNILDINSDLSPAFNAIKMLFGRF